MWYYIKQAFLPFIYLIFLAVTALAVLLIEGLVWLKVILLLVNLGFYLFIVFVFSYKDGQEAMKVRYANDLERMNIVRTGEGLPLKIKEEYKVWKGFLSGGICCIPLVVCLLIHIILITTLGPNFSGAGAVSSFIYMVFFAFALVDVNPGGDMPVVKTSPYTFFWTLLAIPVIMLTVGIAYILGGKKIERQHERIRRKQQEIYGDKN